MREILTFLATVLCLTLAAQSSHAYYDGGVIHTYNISTNSGMGTYESNQIRVNRYNPYAGYNFVSRNSYTNNYSIDVRR